jgi:hypothetical protein
MYDVRRHLVRSARGRRFAAGRILEMPREVQLVGRIGEEPQRKEQEAPVVNTEKYLNKLDRGLEPLDFSRFPEGTRSAVSPGPCPSGGFREAAADPEFQRDPAAPLVIRLNGMPATAANLGRIRERIRQLNLLLDQSDTPLHLRLL